MRLYYVAFARIPTEKAHGLTIVKSCESFSNAGAEVTLFLPRRETQFSEDIFITYGIERNFSVRYLPVIDFLHYSPNRVAFYLTFLSFYISAYVTIFFLPRKNAVIYTRDALLLTLGGPMRKVLECHHVFGKTKRYMRTAHRASHIVTISKALKEKFLQAGFSKEKILVAPSGVDLSVFTADASKEKAREECGIPQGSIIAYTGNFTTMGKDKGISSILQALAKLPGVFFVAAGGSDNDIQKYKEEASLLGVQNRVIFKGFMPQKKLALINRAADIVLMPFPDMSHYREHMSPVKMFEYMASGRPIIASDLPTIREVLDESTALLVPPGDVNVLTGAIKTLLSDAERGEMLSTKARMQVEQYSWDNRARAILRFL